MRVLDTLHGRQDTSAEAFEQAYRSITAGRRRPDEPLLKWTFYFPLAANLDASIRTPVTFRILAHTFLILPRVAVQQRLGKTALDPHSL